MSNPKNSKLPKEPDPFEMLEPLNPIDPPELSASDSEEENFWTRLESLIQQQESDHSFGSFDLDDLDDSCYDYDSLGGAECRYQVTPKDPPPPTPKQNKGK